MDEYQDRREAAVKGVKARRDFKTHVAVYVIVNLFLVAIWALSGGGYFWPIWVMLGWGIGVAFNAWDAYFKKPVSEEEIQREMEQGND
jgi:hypothetical protein